MAEVERRRSSSSVWATVQPHDFMTMTPRELRHVADVLEEAERSEQMMPLKPLPDYGELMPIDEFVEAVNSGMFIDDDGSGYYATAKGMSDVLALPSLVRKGIVPHRTFTHVMWFNK